MRVAEEAALDYKKRRKERRHGRSASSDSENEEQGEERGREQQSSVIGGGRAPKPALVERFTCGDTLFVRMGGLISDSPHNYSIESVRRPFSLISK